MIGLTTKPNDTKGELIPKQLYCFDFDQTITNIHVHSTLTQYVLGNPLVKKGFITYLNQNKEALGNHDYSVQLKGYPKAVEKHYIDNILKEKNIKHLDKLAQSFIDIYDKGHFIALTSFTSFPFIMKLTVEFILKKHYVKLNMGDSLSIEQSSKINAICEALYIIGGFPTNKGVPAVGAGSSNHIDCKMQHIACAKKHFQIMHNQNVTLIDDSINNIKCASQNGCKTVHVPREKYCSNRYLSKLSALINPQKGKERLMLKSAQIGLELASFSQDNENREYLARPINREPHTRIEPQPVEPLRQMTRHNKRKAESEYSRVNPQDSMPSDKKKLVLSK